MNGRGHSHGQTTAHMVGDVDMGARYPRTGKALRSSYQMSPPLGQLPGPVPSMDSGDEALAGTQV